MTVWGVLLTVLALDVLGIALVLWLASHDRWAQRVARLGQRLSLFVLVPLLVLPPLWLLLLLHWLHHGPLLWWSFAGPLAIARVMPQVDAGGWIVITVVALVLLAAMAAFPLRPRWWSACLSSAGLTAWLFLGMAVTSTGW